MRLSHDSCSPDEFFLFSGLAASERDCTNALHIERLRVANGETLHHAGEPFKNLSVVRTGYFRSGVTTKSGEIAVFGFHMHGEVFGADRVFGGPQDADVIALVDSEVCMIAATDIRQLISDVPAIRQFFHQISVEDIRRMHRFLALLSAKTAEQRLALFLINFGKRLHRRGYSLTEFQLPMTRAQMAAYLLLQAETVSRALKVLAGKGYITVNNRSVKILQLDALREYRGN